MILNLNSATQLLAEYTEIKDIFSGDFYPLTDYSTSQKSWIAWQFDRPDLGVGVIQAFRRQENNSNLRKFTLQVYNLIFNTKFLTLIQDYN